MKNYFILIFSFITLFSFNAISQEDEFVIPKNPDVTLHADDGTLIIARDLYSMKSKLKRYVQLVNPKTNQLLGEAFIRLESTDPEQNIYEQLENSPEKFSGTLTIETGQGILYQRQIVNGEVTTTGNNSGRAAVNPGGGPGPVYNPNVACNLSSIHDCVAYRVEGMNWLQFGLCLLRAPICYAEQWAICTVSVCINHMQYTNPN